MTELTILGGGPAGLGLAFYAYRSGVPFRLFEKSTELGGLCRTFRCGEHLYDSGAHRFHDRDPEITADLYQLLGSELVPVKARSRIYDRGQFVDFPPTPLNIVFSSGLANIGKISLELLRSRRRQQAVVSFADFAVRQFGETLARRFLLNYSEKVWGLPAEKLSPEVATGRLQGMTLRSLLFELIAPGRKVDHLDGKFMYPRRGYGQIAQSIQARLPAQRLHSSHEVTQLESDKNRIRRIHFTSGESFDPQAKIVSTLPLPLLIRLLGDWVQPDAQQNAADLHFRHIRLLFLRLDQPRVSSDASIYIPDPTLCISRVSEPKNRSALMAPDGETSLVVEVPCFLDDPIYRLSTESLAARVIRELASIGLLQATRVIEWRHHFLANAYPVYSLDYPRHVAAIVEALSRIANLDTAGRAGRFFYSHLHDQLRFAKDYVEELMRLAGARNQSECVN